MLLKCKHVNRDLHAKNKVMNEWAVLGYYFFTSAVGSLKMYSCMLCIHKYV